MKHIGIKDVLNNLWKRQDLDTVSLVFDILRKTLKPKVFGMVESIGFSGKILRIKIKGGSVEKTEVRLYQEEIITRLNEVLGKDRFTAIIVV